MSILSSNFILFLIAFIPFISSISVLALPPRNYELQKLVSLIFSALLLVLSFFVYHFFDYYNSDFQLYFPIAHLSYINVTYALSIDALSLWFVILTNLLSFISLVYINRSVTNHKYFFSIVSFIQFFVLQSFLVTDIFMFYVFFEAILIPMFFMIGIWGSYNRNIHASFMLFLYTLFGSLLMLLGIQFFQLEVGSTSFFVLHYYSFDFYNQLFLFLVFFIAFAVKVPMIPVHIWLPEAHGEAPTIGSVLLAGILLKLGLYGMLRIIVPCCPDAIEFFKPFIYLLGLFGVTYTALVTLVQTDLKRIIAYSSVGHMNLSVLGVFSMTIHGLEGAVFSMISHGLVSSGLFICIGILYDRYGTKLVSYYGSLANIMPIFSVYFFILTFCNLAFPGTSAFVGEFLTFSGLVASNMFVFVISSISVILVAVYSVWTFNRVTFGPHNNASSYYRFTDITSEEFTTLFILTFPALVLGVCPNFILGTIHFSILNLLN